MLKNYLKIAFRNLRRQKLFGLINISGLALGISCCLLIYLFVQHEWSYDEFHEKADRIYRVENVDYSTVEASQAGSSIFDTRAPAGVDKFAFLPLPMGPALKERYPEIKEIVRYDEGTALLRNGNKVFEESVNFVEPSFFDVFSFRLLRGNSEKALEDKQSVVLTPGIAEKYFDDENPVGKQLQIKIRDEEQPFTVTGIAEVPPQNSSIRYSVLIPVYNKAFYDYNIDRWNSFNTGLFLELEPGSNARLLQQKLNVFYTNRYKDSIERSRSANDLPDDAKVSELQITPITDIHLDASVPWPGVSNPLYTYILSGIAVLILLIACVNYITLALARSSRRAREVGIRKAAGANRVQVAMQFFGETQMVAFIAMIAGLGLAELFLPVFNDLSGTSFTINYLDNYGFISVLLGITVLTGLLAGGYPAFLLAGFNPVEVLKSNLNVSLRPRFTRLLSVFQYSLSAFLIVSSVIMYRQLEYISSKDLGYSEDQVMVIPTHTGWNEEGTTLMERFRNEVSGMPGVTDVSGMAPPFTQGSNQYGFTIQDENKNAYIYYVDEHFIPTMGMELVAGRNFSEERPADITGSIIVNQALVESMGWENPIGQQLPWKEGDESSVVIGVVKDFHFQSLEAPIRPMLLHMDPGHGGVNGILVKIRQGEIAETLPKLEEAWKEVAGFTPFDYWFMDDAVALQYASHKRWMKIMGYSTLFALLIACMGLFGLAGITTVNKTKEIGIRKVLGAGIKQILILLNKDIIKLVGFSLLIAMPVSWYVMSRWLSDFAYRVEMELSLFLIAGLAALGIALLTVSYHSMKAAYLDPAESLRNE